MYDKEVCHFEMMSQATSFEEELFFKEIAKKYGNESIEKGRGQFAIF